MGERDESQEEKAIEVNQTSIAFFDPGWCDLAKLLRVGWRLLIRRRLRDNGRGWHDGAGRDGQETIESGKIILYDRIIIENKGKDPHDHCEDVTGQDTCNLEDRDIRRWLNGLRGIAQEFCRINKLKDPEKGGENGKGHAHDTDHGGKHGARSSDTPHQINDAAGKSHPRDDVDQRWFF